MTPLIKQNELANPLLSPPMHRPPHEVLEGGPLHHRGQLGLDLRPAFVEDTGIVLGAAVTPEDAALEDARALDGLEHLLQGNLRCWSAQGVAASGAAKRADQAVLHEFLEDLGQETLGEPLGFGDPGELRHRAWRLLGQVDQPLDPVFALATQLPRSRPLKEWNDRIDLMALFISSPVGCQENNWGVLVACEVSASCSA